MSTRSKRFAIREWIWWPKTAIGWIAIIVVAAGCLYAVHWATVTMPRQAFLSFIPNGEIGAPHTVRWMVEHCALDGGYAQSTILPGALALSEISGSNIYRVRWTINNATYAFVFNLNPSPSTLRPANAYTSACLISEGW